ncbi:hypothetical protein R70006_00268 [Paraburkholderia domus]|uniref:hypothetical protein n=1 Tax=Paraburkholderia domus TaxID=2793075 RepID=UPI0019123AEC|nr:hypothetical protein [Paraburkholderia domus]MBK5047745.1 hypothetical protein [Burkholderia sp. R-70006]CAE6689406.1 hypothetical protein R70006_00268 [Paraburkholderia domus]
MQIDFRNFPHPVLSYFSDDYVKCLFQANVSSAVTKTKYRFSVWSKTSSADLLDFVKDGMAVHALHIECPATRFRKLFTAKNEKFDVEVDSIDLEATVYLLPLIVAATDIEGYTSKDFHGDFEGTKFSIKKGDILAIDRDRSFVAQKDIDPLRRVPSIFTVMPNHAENPPLMDLEADGQKVVVKLDPSTYEDYSALSKNAQMAPVLSSLVIIPALTELIVLISQAGEGERAEYATKRWYQVLMVKLAALGYPTTGEITDSAICVAQRLIGQPLRQATQLLSASEEVEVDE